MKKKISHLFLTIALVLPMLLAGATGIKVSAVEQKGIVEGNASVTIHKRVYDKEVSSIIQNTGEEMTDFGGEPLNGVEFTVYDATQTYNDKAKETSAEEATNFLKEHSLNADFVSGLNAMDRVITTGDGVATTKDLPIMKDGMFATYVIVETNAPSDITKRAEPIVLTMPIYQVNSNDVNRHVHVYPKNAKDILAKKTITNVGDLEIDGSDILTVHEGEIVKYRVNALVPTNLGTLNYFRLTDNPDTGLGVLSQTINVEGLEKGTDYKVYENEMKNGFVLYFNVASSKLLEMTGQFLTLTYDVLVTEDAKVDEAMDNSVFVESGQLPEVDPGKPIEPGKPTEPWNPEQPTTPTDPTNPTDPEGPTKPIGPNPDKPVTEVPNVPTDPKTPGTPENPAKPEDPRNPGVPLVVVTGGATFQKVDQQTGKGLGGATFQLVKVDKDGKVIAYATEGKESNDEDGGFIWTTEQPDNATRYTSSTEDGRFKIEGLEYSAILGEGESYALVEVDAPSGYAKLNKPFLFTVEEGSFNAETNTITVENIKKGLLPSTGGGGIIAFLLVGMALMIGAFVWYRRTQTTTTV